MSVVRGITVETVEAGVKAQMLFQRARGAGSRVENTVSNGPLRVRRKAYAEYRATRGHASVAGDMQVSRRGHGATRETRWHRG